MINRVLSCHVNGILVFARVIVCLLTLKSSYNRVYLIVPRFSISCSMRKT